MPGREFSSYNDLPDSVTAIRDITDIVQARQELEKALAEIDEAERAAIFEEWIHLRQESVVTRGRFLTVVGAGLGIASLLLAGIFSWNRMLQRRVGLKTRELEAELTERTGVLEVQLRDAGVQLPVDRELLRRSPTVVAEALALIERAGSDDALLAELAPLRLASEIGDDEARLAYLRSLLEELPEELIERSLAGTTA